MTWWSRFVRRAKEVDLDFEADMLPMINWHLVNREAGSAYWRDAVGDVISLTRRSTPVPSLSDEVGLQHFSRDICESQRSGLIESAVRQGVQGRCLTYVYKRLEMPAFRFFGVVITPAAQGSWMWMVVTIERGTTGEREAIVAARLIETGKLTLESYKSSWARDPYETEYTGVDRSTLRYISDGVEYDAEFPDHPLTKMRRELGRLLAIRLPSAPAA
jgi:hypothetical protein